MNPSTIFNFVFISPLKRVWPFNLINLNFFHPKKICTKILLYIIAPWFWIRLLDNISVYLYYFVITFSSLGEKQRQSIEQIYPFIKELSKTNLAGSIGPVVQEKKLKT
jgi:hypothetical protein